MGIGSTALSQSRMLMKLGEWWNGGVWRKQTDRGRPLSRQLHFHSRANPSVPMLKHSVINFDPLWLGFEAGRDGLWSRAIEYILRPFSSPTHDSRFRIKLSKFGILSFHRKGIKRRKKFFFLEEIDRHLPRFNSQEFYLGFSIFHSEKFTKIMKDFIRKIVFPNIPIIAYLEIFPNPHPILLLL